MGSGLKQIQSKHNQEKELDEQVTYEKSRFLSLEEQIDLFAAMIVELMLSEEHNLNKEHEKIR